MRIWNLCLSIIVLAFAFSCWRYGDWAVNSPENEGMDGSCQGLKRLVAHLLALVLSGVSIIPLFIKKHHIDRWIADFNAPPDYSDESLWKDGMVTRPGKAYDRFYD